jgi:hypothetical protein
MAPGKKEKADMSAFERKRLENIAANQAILKDLSTSAEKIMPKPVAKSKVTTTESRGRIRIRERTGQSEEAEGLG